MEQTRSWSDRLVLRLSGSLMEVFRILYFSYWLVVMLLISSVSSFDPTSGQCSLVKRMPMTEIVFSVGLAVSTLKARPPTSNFSGVDMVLLVVLVVLVDAIDSVVCSSLRP